MATPGQSSHFNMARYHMASGATLPGVAQPISRAQGPTKPHAITAPRSMEAADRKPISAPRATIMKVGSKAKVRFFRLSLVMPLPASTPPGAVLRDPGRVNLPSLISSVMAFQPPATTAPVSRTRTRAMASAPTAYISLMVSAVAMPWGKGSRSTSNICRLNPTATIMPTRLTAKTHSASAPQPNCWPVIMVSAGMGATRPADEIEAPEEAAVWLMLFSNMPQLRVLNSPSSERQKA